MQNDHLRTNPLFLAAARVADMALAPLAYPAALLLKAIRRIGVHRLPVSRAILRHVGVFPIRDHYYEPQFDFTASSRPLDEDRQLPGIDWNVREQLDWLGSFDCAGELKDLTSAKVDDLEFRFGNGAFESGDAEYWYQLIRRVKPRRLFEIGSGHSTLMARMALIRNSIDDPAYACQHVCIEPYEMPWLERAGVQVVREKVEDLSPVFFAELGLNDILFIDSSHMIRPQGDVLFEYLQLLPTLGAGVIVHVHDIFSPRNYLKTWVENEVRFWNEQYLLEAFLSHNSSWSIVGALNYLHHHHFEKLKAIAPYLESHREPGSFYIRRVA